jgi:hypothetical protein
VVGVRRVAELGMDADAGAVGNREKCSRRDGGVVMGGNPILGEAHGGGHVCMVAVWVGAGAGGVSGCARGGTEGGHGGARGGRRWGGGEPGWGGRGLDVHGRGCVAGGGVGRGNVLGENGRVRWVGGRVEGCGGRRKRSGREDLGA